VPRTGEHSSELLAGQARLFKLRQKFEKRKAPPNKRETAVDHGRSPHSPSYSSLAIPQQLPAHLGWNSANVTAVVRGKAKQDTTPQAPINREISQHQVKFKPNASENQSIKLFPDLVLKLLENGKESPGRIWLLLRHLDKLGCGWHTIHEVKQLLSTKSSPFRVCSWRQLRNLLNQGESLFWHRTNGRIWLHSLAKVVQALNLPRLTMRPVTMPVEILTQTIGKVRAHFYATFHSSRTDPKMANGPQKPISRKTITKLTHVHKRTQRRYEKITRVRQQNHFAVAGKATAENLERYSWQHGRASFQLTDYKGYQGKPGGCYTAWQLPNSYSGPHPLAPKGKQKRINQALSDLFMKGMTGNGQGRFETRYYANGRIAAKACNRQMTPELYWYDYQLKMWHFLKS